MMKPRLPDSLVASDTPRYWATRVLLNGRSVTRREALAILAARRVPESQIAEFLSTAETLHGGGYQETARPHGATARPEQRPADPAKQIEDLERQRNELMSRRSTC